jgi:cytidine deaminase
MPKGATRRAAKRDPAPAPAGLSARGRAEEELPSPGLAVRGRPEEELARADRELIAAARRIIRERYYPERHHVGAALRTKSGKVFVGVHLEANVGRIAVCAEAAALAAAAVAGDTEIETIVAVRHTGQVVAPCGMCREMISDYAPQAHVILPVNGGLAVLTIGELLPYKYRKP